MNKELIKKYKAEFDWWLSGGALLCYTEVDGPYHPVDETYWDYPADIGFIIDDEYVEVRKALAEGNDIEYCTVSEHSQPVTSPSNFQALINANHSNKYTFRIKPEYQTFQVGAWVRHPDEYVFQCTDDTTTYGPDYELWKPQPGEWCWFFMNLTDVPQLGRFDTSKFKSYFSIDLTCGIFGFSYCQPFIGALPVHLQES